MLRFPPNYSDYSFGQLLVSGVCNLICFNFLSANDGDMGKKVGSWRSFGFSFDVIATHTKLKYNTSNALSSSPYSYALTAIDFVFFEKAEFVIQS